jgi:hypothetical protein
VRLNQGRNRTSLMSQNQTLQKSCDNKKFDNLSYVKSSGLVETTALFLIRRFYDCAP